MEKRRQPRAFTESTCKARFQLGQVLLDDLNVANLGAGGCCLELPPLQGAALVFTHRELDLELFQPGLPVRTVKARIVWQKEELAGGTPALRCGIKFMDTPVGYAEELDQAVEYLSRSNFRGNAWILAQLRKEG